MLIDIWWLLRQPAYPIWYHSNIPQVLFLISVCIPWTTLDLPQEHYSSHNLQRWRRALSNLLIGEEYNHDTLERDVTKRELQSRLDERHERGRA